MECNMIYIQKNILFENKKHQVIGKLENTLFEKFIENWSDHLVTVMNELSWCMRLLLFCFWIHGSCKRESLDIKH